jgi:hypothetical protein
MRTAARVDVVGGVAEVDRMARLLKAQAAVIQAAVIQVGVNQVAVNQAEVNQAVSRGHRVPRIVVETVVEVTVVAVTVVGAMVAEVTAAEMTVAEAVAVAAAAVVIVDRHVAAVTPGAAVIRAGFVAVAPFSHRRKSSKARSRACLNCIRAAMASCGIQRRTMRPKTRIRLFPVHWLKNTNCAKAF